MVIIIIYIEDYISSNPQFLYGILKYNFHHGIKSIINCQTEENIPKALWDETLGLFLRECSEKNIDYSKHLTFINTRETTDDNITYLYSLVSKDARDNSLKLTCLSPFELHRTLEKLFT